MTDEIAEALQAALISDAEDDGRSIVTMANVVSGLFAIARGLEKVAEAIESYRTDHPLQGETFHNIETALEAIATAIDEHK